MEIIFPAIIIQRYIEAKRLIWTPTEVYRSNSSRNRVWNNSIQFARLRLLSESSFMLQHLTATPGIEVRAFLSAFFSLVSNASRDYCLLMPPSVWFLQTASFRPYIVRLKNWRKALKCFLKTVSLAATYFSFFYHPDNSFRFVSWMCFEGCDLKLPRKFRDFWTFLCFYVLTL